MQRVLRVEWVAVSCLAGLAFAAVLYSSRQGAYLSPDSVTYYSIARHLARGDGVVDFTQTNTTVFPPVYPFVLSLGLRLHLSIDATARVLNAWCAAGSTLIVWRMVRKQVRYATSALFGVAMVAASAVMVDIGRHSWSEPLFCVLLLGCLTLVRRCIGSESMADVVVVGVLGGLALMTRYASMSIVVTGIVAFLFLSPTWVSLRRRIQKSAVFALTAFVVFAPWLIRNVFVNADEVLGTRVGDPTRVSSLLMRLGGAVGQVLMPVWAVERWSVRVIVFGVVTVCVIAAMLATRLAFFDGHNAPGRAIRSGGLRGPNEHGAEEDRTGVHRSNEDRADAARVLARLLVVFVVVYMLMLVVSAKMSGSSIDQRTAAPIGPVFVCLVALVFDRLRNAPQRLLRRVVTSGVVLFALINTGFFAAATLAPTTDTSTYRTTPGPGSLAARLRTTPLRGLLMSNNPWTISSAVGYEPLRPYPPRRTPGVSIVHASYTDIVDAACGTGASLAWYAQPGATVPNLGSGLTTIVGMRGNDGVLYVIHAAPSLCARGPRRSSLRARGAMASRYGVASMPSGAYL